MRQEMLDNAVGLEVCLHGRNSFGEYGIERLCSLPEFQRAVGALSALLVVLVRAKLPPVTEPMASTTPGYWNAVVNGIRNPDSRLLLSLAGSDDMATLAHLGWDAGRGGCWPVRTHSVSGMQNAVKALECACRLAFYWEHCPTDRLDPSLTRSLSLRFTEALKIAKAHDIELPGQGIIERWLSAGQDGGSLLVMSPQP